MPRRESLAFDCARVRGASRSRMLTFGSSATLLQRNVGDIVPCSQIRPNRLRLRRPRESLSVRT